MGRAKFVLNSNQISIESIGKEFLEFQIEMETLVKSFPYSKVIFKMYEKSFTFLV